jgi:hypothetical protein
MIITAQNMFTYLLDAINKESTGTITPDEANRLLNNAQEEWVKNKYYEKRCSNFRIAIRGSSLLQVIRVVIIMVICFYLIVDLKFSTSMMNAVEKEYLSH